GVIRSGGRAAGMPLAIELAAAWVRILSCTAIADEIARNLGFLAARRLDLPERHRSVQATFDQSWAHLDDEARGVFARLAVFRGGFSRAAAGPVAGATLPPVARLPDACLVRRDADDRYQLHELLRQYASARLRERPEAFLQAQAAHGGYYMQFLAVRAAPLLGREQDMAAAEIDREVD